MFERSKAKKECSSSITNRWIRSNSFNVWKNDGWVCSMSNLVNLVIALFVSMVFGWKPVQLMFDKMAFNQSLEIWSVTTNLSKSEPKVRGQIQTQTLKKNFEPDLTKLLQIQVSSMLDFKVPSK